MQEKPSLGQGGDLDFADTLWQAADKLRGTVDAAEYKHVVLGLLFLKYISDAFEARRDALRAELEQTGIKGEQIERLLESRDEYTAENVFWVPPESRWVNLRAQPNGPTSQRSSTTPSSPSSATTRRSKTSSPRLRPPRHSAQSDGRTH